MGVKVFERHLQPGNGRGGALGYDAIQRDPDLIFTEGQRKEPNYAQCLAELADQQQQDSAGGWW